MTEWVASVLNNPNIIYVALVAGLWAAVTAAYIPGTGIAEGLSAALVLGAFVLLAQQATVSWLAVLLIAVGILGFLLLPFLPKRYWLIIQVASVLQAVGGWLLFPQGVSWVVIVVTLGGALAYHHYLLMPIFQTARQTALEPPPAAAGSQGYVMKDFTPQGQRYLGIAQISGEQWTAYSDAPLVVGDAVIVVERSGLQVTVRKA